jgi:hypothetical protein
MYNSTHLTSALDGGEWSASRSGRFTQGKSPRYPLDRRLGGPHSRSGHGIEDKNPQPPPGIEPRSSSPQPTELSRLIISDCKKLVCTRKGWPEWWSSDLISWKSISCFKSLKGENTPSHKQNGDDISLLPILKKENKPKNEIQYREFRSHCFWRWYGSQKGMWQVTRHGTSFPKSCVC